MRIALVALHFAEYAFLLAKSLAKNNEVLLIAESGNFNNELGRHYLDECGNLRVEFVDHAPKIGSIVSNARRLVKLISEFSPDVVHCQENMRDCFILALPWIKRYPFVLTVHDPKPHSGKDSRVFNFQRHGYYLRVVRRLCDVAIVHGDKLSMDLVSVVPSLANRVFVVPHGPLGMFNADQRRREQENGVLLFFGRIEAYKGLGDFVEAVEILAQRGVPVKGVVAGRGSDLEPYRERIAGSPNFELIEKYIPRNEVIDLFDRAEIVVQPYLNATQSGVALLAIGRGRAIVATDVGCIRDVVKNGVNGVLVLPGNSALLSNAIASLLCDKIKLAQYSEASAKLAVSQIGWDHIADLSICIYQNLIDGHKAVI